MYTSVNPYTIVVIREIDTSELTSYDWDYTVSGKYGGKTLAEVALGTTDVPSYAVAGVLIYGSLKADPNSYDATSVVGMLGTDYFFTNESTDTVFVAPGLPAANLILQGVITTKVYARYDSAGNELSPAIGDALYINVDFPILTTASGDGARRVGTVIGLKGSFIEAVVNFA